MNERKQRPGVMLYFDTLCPALARLNNEQRGELLQGIVEYAQTGAIPELDGMTGMAFDMLRPGIDRDGEKYEYKRMHGQYMAYCRAANERGETRISEEEFIKQLIATDSYYQLPNTTPSPYPSPYSYPSITPSPTAAAYPYPAADAPGKGEAEGCKGDERENPSDLQALFIEAIKAGDNTKALTLSNQLYKLGYDVDKATGQMTRRA